MARAAGVPGVGELVKKDKNNGAADVNMSFAVFNCE